MNQSSFASFTLVGIKIDNILYSSTWLLQLNRPLQRFLGLPKRHEKHTKNQVCVRYVLTETHSNDSKKSQ